jgi:mannose-6-phosphate isomerase
VLEALDTAPLSPAPAPAARERASAAVTELLPRDADPYFRAQRIELHDDRAQLDQGFAILVVLDGRATLDADGGGLALSSGDTVLVPYGAGAGTLQGDATLIRCAPPAPDAGGGER